MATAQFDFDRLTEATELEGRARDEFLRILDGIQATKRARHEVTDAQRKVLKRAIAKWRKATNIVNGVIDGTPD
jgi:hypothetical protein